MTKYWFTLTRRTKIAKDLTMEFPAVDTEDQLFELLQDACKSLNLSLPVILRKHMQELRNFHHTRFWPGDFVESLPFDFFEVHELPDEKPDRA